MPDLFPMLPLEATVQDNPTLPVYREIAWDFVEDKPIYKNGGPVFVEGKEAVLVWAYNALKTTRYLHEIYTFDYGCEGEILIGQAYSEDLKQTELPRLIRECLLMNPYIDGVSEIDAQFQGDTLTVSANLNTIYGEVPVNV